MNHDSTIGFWIGKRHCESRFWDIFINKMRCVPTDRTQNWTRLRAFPPKGMFREKLYRRMHQKNLEDLYECPVLASTDVRCKVRFVACTPEESRKLTVIWTPLPVDELSWYSPPHTNKSERWFIHPDCYPPKWKCITQLQATKALTLNRLARNEVARGLKLHS